VPGWSLITHANVALLPVSGKVIPTVQEQLNAPGGELVAQPLLVARRVTRLMPRRRAVAGWPQAA
jgi:hypothetical protein